MANKLLEEVLQVANARIIESTNDEDYKLIQKMMSVILEEVLEVVNNDDDLRIFNPRILLGGSLADGTKVPTSDVDIAIVLRLPSIIQPRIIARKPGYVSVEIRKRKLAHGVLREVLDDWLDNNGYLLTDRVRSDVQSWVDRAMKTFPNGKVRVDGRILQIRKIQIGNGPALKFTIKIGRNKEYYVDFVPRIEITDTSQWPKNCKPNPLENKFGNFSLVAKNPKNCPFPERYWRISFSDQENVLMHDKNFLKPTIRLIKCFKDATGLDKLNSFVIRQFFLYELAERGGEFFQNSLSECFLTMLEDLRDCLYRDRAINYYWSSGFKVLEDVDDHYISVIQKALNIFRNSRDHKVMLSYLVNY